MGAPTVRAMFRRLIGCRNCDSFKLPPTCGSDKKSGFDSSALVYDLRMSPGSRVYIAVLSASLLSLTSIVFGMMPEDPQLQKWLAVPARQAGVVLEIGFPVWSASVSSAGKIVANKKWTPKVPLVWQLRVEPDNYQIEFNQGPIWSLGVIAKQPGSLTYVRLGLTDESGFDIKVTSGATPPADLVEWLQTAEKIGVRDAWNADYVEAGNRVLLVSTEPPWPIPPPPPPPKR